MIVIRLDSSFALPKSISEIRFQVSIRNDLADRVALYKPAIAFPGVYGTDFTLTQSPNLIGFE